MKKGLSVTQVVTKAANQYIRNSIKKAINPISEEIKKYISKLVELEMPEMAEEILMLDIRDIVATVLDFVDIYQTHKGIRVEIQLENVVGLIESITSMVHHNPAFIDETLAYFNDLQIDTKVIERIVINNIKSAL